MKESIVLPGQATELPRTLFSGIARNYDRPASVLSLFQYVRWHRFLLSRLNVTTPARVLDMATGTGALALQVSVRPGIEVLAADITRPMLLEARSRSDHCPRQLDLLECSAEHVPLAAGSFDGVIFTYLLRYVADVPAVLQELGALVKPGGRLLSLEFAVPRGPFYPLWRVYTDLVLPLASTAVSPQWGRVGRFLGPSIRDFYRRWPEDRLLDLWRAAGFADVKAQRLSLGGAIVTWGTRET